MFFGLKTLYQWMAWLLYASQKSSIEVKSVDTTCDNKISKATDGGHQLTKRICLWEEA